MNHLAALALAATSMFLPPHFHTKPRAAFVLVEKPECPVGPNGIRYYVFFGQIETRAVAVSCGDGVLRISKHASRNDLYSLLAEMMTWPQ